MSSVINQQTGFRHSFPKSSGEPRFVTAEGLLPIRPAVSLCLCDRRGRQRGGKGGSTAEPQQQEVTKEGDASNSSQPDLFDKFPPLDQGKKTESRRGKDLETESCCW